MPMQGGSSILSSFVYMYMYMYIRVYVIQCAWDLHVWHCHSRASIQLCITM